MRRRLIRDKYIQNKNKYIIKYIFLNKIFKYFSKYINIIKMLYLL